MKEPVSTLTLEGKLVRKKRVVVGVCPQLSVGSQGYSEEEARRNLAEAVRIFLEETARMGTRNKVLKEGGLPSIEGEQPLVVKIVFRDSPDLVLTTSIRNAPDYA